MIFKQIFGKTVDAAILSAKQMYGDNFTVFKTTPGKGKEHSVISIIAEDKRKAKGKANSQKKNGKMKPGAVYFERSGGASDNDHNKTEFSHQLQSLRRLAATQTDTDASAANKTRIGFKQGKRFNSGAETKTPAATRPPKEKPLDVYKRSSFKNKTEAKSLPHEKPFDEQEAEKELLGPKSLLSKFDESKPRIAAGVSELPSEKQLERKNEFEIKALHKRFDKIEALLNSQLASSNLNHTSHPVFQQLIQTGIQPAVVFEWFGRAVEKGFDPENRPDDFMGEISSIIKNALTNGTRNKPAKYQLFAGPAGSGKTSLIMKLLLNDQFTPKGKTAVISVMPSGEKSTNYFTVLEPFCKAHKIDYFSFSMDEGFTNLDLATDKYSRFYIDTPSLKLQNKGSFREYWKLRDELESLKSLEVHFTVNVSNSRHYFNSSTALNHPLKPDFLALTHMDETSEWGPVIPLFEKMGCNARYLSLGDCLNTSLKEFKPEWLTRKILERND
ncbi:MAG: hypothetical protein LAT84_07260 [Balneolia bacterium]|nr:hypothetical protein [Balneolia bacterium]